MPRIVARKKAMANCRQKARSGDADVQTHMDASVVAKARADDHALAAGNVHFRHPFRIKGIDRLLPPGGYEVVTDEEMIEGLSFPCLSPRRHHDHGARRAAAAVLDWK